MKWLYYILVLSFVAMVATALAGYLRVQRHRRGKRLKPE